MSKNIQISASPVAIPDTPVFPEDLEARIKDTLALLADVDRAYDQRREAIKQTSGSLVQKKRLRAELDSLHRSAREPLVLRLAELHYRMMRATLFKTIH